MNNGEEVGFNEDEYNDKLFGPDGYRKLNEMQLQSNTYIEGETSPAEPEAKELVQISVFNLDNGLPDLEKQEVFGYNKSGSLKRDHIA